MLSLRVLPHTSTCVKAVGRRCIIRVRKFRLRVNGELSNLHLRTPRWIWQMRTTPLRELERHLAQCEHRRLMRAPPSTLFAFGCRKYVFLLNECFLRDLIMLRNMPRYMKCSYQKRFVIWKIPSSAELETLMFVRVIGYSGASRIICESSVGWSRSAPSTASWSVRNTLFLLNLL